MAVTHDNYTVRLTISHTFTSDGGTPYKRVIATASRSAETIEKCRELGDDLAAIHNLSIQYPIWKTGEGRSVSYEISDGLTYTFDIISNSVDLAAPNNPLRKVEKAIIEEIRRVFPDNSGTSTPPHLTITSTTNGVDGSHLNHRTVNFSISGYVQ